MFKFAVGISITFTFATLGAGVWAFVHPPLFSYFDGLPVGNKQLVAYRLGATEFRIATITEEEVFLSPDSKNWPALRQEYRRWGGRDHWLKVPAGEMNLCWALAYSLVLPAIALARRMQRARLKGAGFPVIGTGPAT